MVRLIHIFTHLRFSNKSRRLALQELKRMDLIRLLEIKKLAEISNSTTKEMEQIYEKLMIGKKEKQDPLVSMVQGHTTLLTNCYRRITDLTKDFISTSLLHTSYEANIMADSFHFEHLLDLVLEAAKPHALEKKLVIYTTIDRNLRTISIDPIKTGPVLIPIIDLGIFYAATGSAIRITASKSDRQLSFSIILSVDPNRPHAKEELLSEGTLFEASPIFHLHGIFLVKEELKLHGESFTITESGFRTGKELICITAVMKNQQENTAAGSQQPACNSKSGRLFRSGF